MKTVISTEKAPAAIGPYSQGIQAGSLIITSGQLPIDPATGAFPATIEEQTRQSLENCKAVLAAAKRHQDDRFPQRHEQLRSHERRVRHVLRGRLPRAQRS